jgi:hypothetical protein
MTEHTEAERLRSAEVTLATIAEHARQGLAITADATNEHARGYATAMRDIQAILGARYRPEGEPVTLPGAWP